MFARGITLLVAIAFAVRVPAFPGAANWPKRWRLSRTVLEPWLLGLAGFSLTAAGLLANQEAPINSPTASVVEQIKFKG